MRSLFAAMRKGRKRKRGASLAMVLVSMTVLTIMGTLFTTIAMRSYQYSYSRLCRQQAYYTASSSVESFYNYVSSNPNVLSVMITQLNDACEGKVSSDDETQTYATIDPTTVRLKVGSTGGGAMTGDTVSLVPNGFFDLYLGSCTLWVRFNNTDRTEISVEAEATYNGYSETVRAIIARTNGAASELKKIFDNTFCLQSPITTIVAETTMGDIYVSQPIADTNSTAVQDLGAAYITAYNTVFEDLTEDKSSGGYDGVPGQYLRDNDGNIITDTNTNAGKYNLVLKKGVYGNAQASTAEGTLIGHTKPYDMDNSPLMALNIDQPTHEQKPREDENSIYNLWYNDWVELYMFSATDGGTAVNGNLYANSKVLIGLLDRNNSNRNYRRLWKDSVKRNVFSAVANANWTNYYLMDPEFNRLDTNARFEHGFKEDVFFDHDGTILTRTVSKFRLNGDMYLWEDARIENFDSYNTDNVKEGKKNNIYAAKDLYIDGFYIISWHDFNGKIDETATEVNVGGDVVVKGNAFISNAEIHGDVYCYGDELTIVNSIIHGNVYFTGSDFTSDTTVYNGNVVINHDGSNTAVTSYAEYYIDENGEKKPTFGTTHDVGNTPAHSWGATITNCDIYGTLWSNVNTHLLISKWGEGGDSIPNYYGHIYVSKYLFIDLIWTYFCDYKDQRVINTYYQMDTDTIFATPEVSGHRENWLAYYNDTGNDEDRVNDKYDAAASYNCFEYTKKYTNEIQVIYAERFQLRTNQKDPDGGKSTDVNYLGHLYVGNGGLYIDGNEHGHDGRGPGGSDGSRNAYNGLSTKFESLYTASAGNIWDVTVSDVIKNETIVYWEGIIRKTASWYNYYGMNYNGSVSAGEHKGEYDTKLAGYIQNGSMYRENGSTSPSSLNFSHMHSIMPVHDNYAEKFGDPVWKDKLIKIRTWSAPVAGNETEFNLVKGLIVKYVGETLPEEGGGGNILFGDPTTTDVADYIETYSDAFEVTDSGNTLIISDSVTFNCFADFSDYKRVIFDTSEGNIYVKFLYGAEFGKAQTDTSSPTSSEVVLTGGNMVFWHFYQEDTYDFKQPTLQINPYTNVGIVTASSGAGHGNDGLYIISNDDSLITMGSNAVLNGFVYTPYGAVYIAPSESRYIALNGCMAIESLILLNTADELPQGSIFDQIKDRWEELIGGGNVTENVDSLVKQYENIVFNYVQPPLITDSVLMGGLTDQEVTDFNSVVWEFLGYY